jgi:flagellar motor switch protein FliG
MNRTLITAAISVGLLLAAPVTAQEGVPEGLSTAERLAAEQMQGQTATQARRTIENLFSRLCPGRCELVELKVTMASPTPVGDVVPGFETVAGQNFESEPESIDVTVLLDAKLPRNFQSNLPRMIRYRLNNLAPTINVRPEVLDFPEPQLEPMPPYMPEPPQRSYEPPPPLPEPEPVVEPQPEPEPAAEEPEPEPTIWDRLQPFLESLAPWIGPIIMVLILFGLLMALVRRLTEANRPAGAAGAGEGDRKAPADLDVGAARDDLNATRAVRNRVLRRWLTEDPEGVSRLVMLMGPEIMSDLKSDSSLAPDLERVSELVARQRDPLDDEATRQTLSELRARLTSARLVHDEQGLAMDWEFLEGLGVANLRRIVSSCSATEKMYVVSQLPPSLRAGYLDTLDGAERRELVLGTSADVLSKQEALALAARLRKAADEVSHIGREADGQAALVLDMLRALKLEEQEQMLREIKGNRPELAQSVLGRFVLETTTLHLPKELLADAVHRSPVETLTAFLRGTRAAVRDHLLSIAPASKREAVMTELSLDIPVTRGEFLEARQRFLDVVAEVVRRDGIDVARANTRVLMGGTSINPVPDEASV